MNIDQRRREVWLYQRLVARARRKNRREFRENLSAISPYAALFIVIQLMGAAIIMYLAKKDAAANQNAPSNPPAPSSDSRPGLPPPDSGPIVCARSTLPR